MSSYHGKIMNIPTRPDAAIEDQLQARNAAIEDQLQARTDTDLVMAYKIGHRDARHAAAEIANEADQRIAELEAQLAAANARIEQLEIERRDKFFEDLANNMPDEFGN